MSSLWRAKCPEAVEKRILLAEGEGFRITQQLDTSKFCVEKLLERHMVSLGPLHKCSCQRAQPCLHVIGVLLEWCHVSRTNPILWQQGIREMELQELLRSGFNQRQQCVLCRERMTTRDGCSLCGISFHTKCAELKSKAQGQLSPRCPKCKSPVDTESLNRFEQCTHCHKRCGKERYACAFCPTVLICSRCYLLKNVHPIHPLSHVRVCNSSIAAEGQHGSANLEDRELVPEDYHLLLSLDSESNNEKLSQEQFDQLTTQNFTGNDLNAKHCMICLRMFQEGSRVVVFSCGHLFHESCGRRWVTQHKATCPIDQQPCQL